jgi:hypothetical protein
MSKNTGNTILALLTGAAIELVGILFVWIKVQKQSKIKDSYKMLKRIYKKSMKNFLKKKTN